MRFRRPMLVLGMTILFIQSVFMPVGMVYAQTTMDTEEHEPVELPAIQNYLEELTDDPNFFFHQSYMQGIVNSPINVTIYSDKEVSEAKIRLPEEATIIKDHIPERNSVVQGDEPYEWIVQSERVQTTFVLPLLFESTGKYELSVKGITATVEINIADSCSNESARPEREATESSLNNDKEEILKDNNSEEQYKNEEFHNTRSTENVSTWAQYAAAINNQNVTVINVTANISGNTSLNTINRNLTINGNGFTINSQAQQYNITGANSQLTVRNAIINGSLTGSEAQFRSGPGASNTRFIFSDIRFLGRNRFVGPVNTNNDVFQTVIFDGGNSYFEEGSNAAVFANISELQLINQASVMVSSRRFATSVVGTSVARTNAFTVSIEEGAYLSSNDSPGDVFFDTSLIVDGHLEVDNAMTRVITMGSQRTQPIQITLGSTSKVILKQSNAQTPVFNLASGAGGEISIEKGAEFDFINKSGGPVINSGSNSTPLTIESAHLALWDLGLQEEEKASIVFSDIHASLSGANGSVIDTTTNDRFQKLYDSSGLTAYSRMSNRTVEEMERTVVAKYLDANSNEITESEVITGLLGENYQTRAKQISGYQLIDSPSNGAGEFSRETIEVCYVYETANVSPVDPMNPEIEVDPENQPKLPEDQGLLSIDFISSFTFGSQAISAQTKRYYAQPQRLLNLDGTLNDAEERPNYIQVSDRRPDNERKGWTLAVTQNSQFTDRQDNQLRGARLLLNNQQFASVQENGEPMLQNQDGVVLIPEQKMPLVTARNGQGAGTWIYRFGDGESAGESVALEVPPTADPRTTTYQTTLTWELSAVPDN
ncbi:WxL domain-containing protein [Enterococcus casseliflavus]|uniref:WxL domain-containing protein n=1 Tax=Enterococcus casseliflavus TaxID=37734 RepID=UPI002DB97DC0|nr:WxL domain-containing protein [Enterococcus casseliflavus]MEB6146447.1 WxL domain-containing protein [Enterococcus casseliflavus]